MGHAAGDRDQLAEPLLALLVGPADRAEAEAEPVARQAHGGAVVRADGLVG